MTETLKTIRRNGINLIISGMGLICLVLGVIYFLLHDLVLKPVDHLHHVAQRMIDGE